MLSTSHLFKKYNFTPDAMVISLKNDHKYIFLKDNKPKNLKNDPKNRIKGQWYIKDNRKIYPVIVEMYEHEFLKGKDNDFLDIWIVDNLNQAQEQLDLLVKYGAKQFKKKIKIF